MTKKVAVITGAGSGLGASLGLKYSHKGYNVCLLGRTKEKLKQVGKELPNHYKVYGLDISKYEEVQKVFQTIIGDFGQVDLLINNAGVGYFKQAEDLSKKEVHQMIDINLKGTIFCTQAILPLMKEKDQGTIANIISTAGLEGKTTETVYCASKFGVRGFTESLALEVEGSNIHVFAAYMGGMKTSFWDGIYETEEMSHLMHPDDIADIIINNLHSRKRLTVSEVTIRNKPY